MSASGWPRSSSIVFALAAFPTWHQPLLVVGALRACWSRSAASCWSPCSTARARVSPRWRCSARSRSGPGSGGRSGCCSPPRSRSAWSSSPSTSPGMEFIGILMADAPPIAPRGRLLPAPARAGSRRRPRASWPSTRRTIRSRRCTTTSSCPRSATPGAIDGTSLLPEAERALCLAGHARDRGRACTPSARPRERRRDAAEPGRPRPRARATSACSPVPVRDEADAPGPARCWSISSTRPTGRSSSTSPQLLASEVIALGRGDPAGGGVPGRPPRERPRGPHALSVQAPPGPLPRPPDHRGRAGACGRRTGPRAAAARGGRRELRRGRPWSRRASTSRPSTGSSR